ETESTPDYLKNIQQQLEEYTKNFNTQVQNAFDSDKIKSEVNNFIESLGKILNTEKKEAPK
uniref:Anionic antimicrobial peptide 2 n=3 Tax=Galleria mellonella TaxID=7137 RepID=AP2_GALME|nr:RecName: Full=Anionic antimicrobial peptide 2 [Galleria mellonella]